MAIILQNQPHEASSLHLRLVPYWGRGCASSVGLYQVYPLSSQLLRHQLGCFLNRASSTIAGLLLRKSSIMAPFYEVRRPPNCSNVHHGYQEKLCRQGGLALRARRHRGKEKTTVVLLGSRAINSSKQCRAVHSCTSATPTRLCTRGRDKRETEQCASLLLHLRTTVTSSESHG